MLYFLLSVTARGFLWTVLLLAVCFLVVHTLRLAQLGKKYRRLKQEEETRRKDEPEKKAPPPSTEEPIYYLVERKRRAKSEYGEPKRIRFK